MQKKRLTRKGKDPRSNKCSVYTSTFNSDPLILRKVFEHLKAQTTRDWEWIVFDDSTLDHVWPLLMEFSKEHFGVKPYTYKRDGIDSKYIVSDTRSNYKVGFAKKICCELATGKFLVELDHDDYLVPEALETIVLASKNHPDAGFFYSDYVEPNFEWNDFSWYPDHWGCGFGAHYWYWDIKTNRYALGCRSPQINFTTLGHITAVPNHVRVWRADAYEKAGGYNSDLPVVDDYDLILKTVKAGIKMVKIPIPLYYQHFHNKQTQVKNKELISAITPQVKEIHWPEIQKLFPDHVEDRTNCFEYYMPNPYINETYQPNYDLVSIILPTWERSGHLIEAINSVLNQTYQNFELIVIGDNCKSLDRVMRDWFRGQTKIKWYNLENNYGAGGAIPRNYALKNLALGQYIAYMDNDNTIEPTHIEDLRNAIEGVDYAFTDMNMDGRILKCREPKRYRIDTSSIMHRKELLERHGYWKTREEAGYAHDWELVSRWKGYKWRATGKATLNYNLEFNDQDIDGIFNEYGDQDGS
tara:strand:- start:276 stop:1853 length:1578 start_codon:yes stop_codon:yes gene_type:complete